MFDRKDVQVNFVRLHALGGHMGTATYSDFIPTILRFRQQTARQRYHFTEGQRGGYSDWYFLSTCSVSSSLLE